jgi:phosphoglycolate phosphatase
LHSFSSYAETHQRVARDLSWPVPTRGELVPYLHDWHTTLRGLFPGRDIETFVKRYAEIADEHPYRAVPGAVNALTSLRTAGHCLFIVTKRDRTRLSSRLVQASVPEALFDGIFTVDEQPAPKPDPRCFAPVWKALGASSASALMPQPIYVGDREEDRLAARGAGIRFVAVRTGPEVAMGFPRDTPASNVIDSVADFPAWLESEASRSAS